MRTFWQFLQEVQTATRDQLPKSGMQVMPAHKMPGTTGGTDDPMAKLMELLPGLHPEEADMLFKKFGHGVAGATISGPSWPPVGRAKGLSSFRMGEPKIGGPRTASAAGNPHISSFGDEDDTDYEKATPADIAKYRGRR